MRVALLLLFLTGASAGVREEGQRLEAERRWAEAAALYESELARTQGAERTWLLTSLAEMAFNQQDYRAASRWLRQAEAATGASREDRLRFLNARATLQLVAGRLSSAEDELLKALELARAIGPKATQATILHNLASIEAQTGRLTQAIGRERKALRLWGESGESDVYIQRGWISLSSLQGLGGDWRGAEDSLRRALALGETPELLSNYAVVLERLHRREEARRARNRIQSLQFQTGVVNVRSLPFEKEDVKVTVR